jgi:hypothetical protein
MYAVYFAVIYQHKGSTLVIVTIMSLGKVYYDPKHAAGFGSVAKLVKAGKTKEGDVEEWL